VSLLARDHLAPAQAMRKIARKPSECRLLKNLLAGRGFTLTLIPG
jgi:hypothetical protein